MIRLIFFVQALLCNAICTPTRFVENDALFCTDTEWRVCWYVCDVCECVSVRVWVQRLHYIFHFAWKSLVMHGLWKACFLSVRAKVAQDRYLRLASEVALNSADAFSEGYSINYVNSLAKLRAIKHFFCSSVVVSHSMQSMNGWPWENEHVEQWLVS